MKLLLVNPQIIYIRVNCLSSLRSAAILNLIDTNYLNIGIWSPSGTPQPTRREIKPVSSEQSTPSSRPNVSQSPQAPTPPPPPIWKPRSADPSPVLERKDFRPVQFQSPQLARKNLNPQKPNWSQSTSSLNTRPKSMSLKTKLLS